MNESDLDATAPTFTLAPTGYVAQCARDAQSANYGGRSYWDELERSSLRHFAHFALRGDMETAVSMLTRSLSESLMGNDGD